MSVFDSTEMALDHISPNKARQILERVDLLSKIREDILSHPHLEERLSLCQPSADTPDWWQTGKHDKELLLGAAKHGLGRTDITILNDPDFSFHKILGKSIYNSVQAAKNFDKLEKAIKIENREDILKFDKDEILVKLEKGEGTLKIEKVGIKKDKDAQFSEKKLEAGSSEKGQVELTLVKAESFSESKMEDIVANNGLTITTVKAKSPEKEIPAKEVVEEEKRSEPPKEEEKAKEKEIEKERENEKEMEVEKEKEIEIEIEIEIEKDLEEKKVAAEVEDKVKPDEENEEKEEEKDEKNEKEESKEQDEKIAEKKVVAEVEEKVEEKEKEAEKPEEVPDKTILKKDDEKETEKEEVKEDTVKVESTEETPKETKSEYVAKIEESISKDDITVPEEKEVETKEKAPAKIEDKCSVQAAELKAMFPDLEVIQPLSRLTQIDTFVLRDKTIDYTEPTVAQLLAHSYQSSIKWPKEHAIEARLRHIVHAVEHKEWPVSVNFTAGDETEIMSNEKDNSEVITITTDHGLSRSLAAANNISAAKKRKRHIAIDVETERAKLHALLNSTHMTSQPPTALSKPILSSSCWEANDESQSEESRRSTPVQPPPAHQQTRAPAIPFDLKYTVPGKTTVIPGTSSTLTPIDLSAGYPKAPTETNKDMMNEVQDFSMPNKNKQVSSNKGKLDSMLDKLMKRKNCPTDEPVVGKEKKRRKLDEIVLGLSAAKEQQSSHYPEHGKKSTITPNVTVTPTSAPIGLPNPPAASQKPFSITVTSIPSSRASGSSSGAPPPSLHSHKESFSALFAQAEQQNRELVKKQHQQQQQQHQQQQQQAYNSVHASSSSHRKSYEAMIADINKVAEYSSKIGSYSHEAKVNKWLAEQTAMSEQLNAEYLNAPRRRRPRVDPSALNWKNLTGEENVAVINRLTGKKVTGSKAPQLKRLGQWLMENPMFDVDPKWAELVKERGNLPHDLQKRLPGSERSSGSNKGKSPGRPPMMASPTSQQSVNQANLAATSMASSLNFPSLSTINSSLLSGLSLGNFDPKNNPLLMPFGGLPNLGALGGLGNLGNLSNMSLTNSLFANLAGLGLPSLAGMEAALGATATSTADTNVVTSVSSNKMSTGTSSSSKSRTKMEPPTSKSSAPSTSTASNLPTTTPFPFFFPNPSLLYTPLGLGGLNPFSMQPGSVSSAYESLAQCGLLNPPTSSASTSSSRKSTSASTSSSRRDPIDSMKRKEPEKKPRYPTDAGINLQQFAESAQHNEERRRSESAQEKRDQERREVAELSEIADLSARIERKSKEQEMKEALEQLSRTSAELLTRNLEEIQRPMKRGRSSDSQAPEQSQIHQPQFPAALEVTLEPVVKKSKSEPKAEGKSSEKNETKSPEKSSEVKPSPTKSSDTKETKTPESKTLEVETSLKLEPEVEASKSVTPPPPVREPSPTPAAPESVKPTEGLKEQLQEEKSSPIKKTSSINKGDSEAPPTEAVAQTSSKSESLKSEIQKSESQKHSDSQKSEKSQEVEEETKCPKTKKARGGKRLSVEPPPERKNLRSSAGRQARAAAERQARMEGEQHTDHHEGHGSGE